MKPNDEIEAMEVFAGTTWQAEMVKSLLENSKIEAYMKDEFVGTLSPWWTAPGGAGSVKVVVSSLDYQRAKAIVDEFEDTVRNEI
jgi:hypothetical protein